jgi:uncharacterized membrane-anchored protein YjiN (DUF445 family)
MEFKITEAEAREMARFEEEVGYDISAGPDWGSHFGKVLEFVLNQPDHEKFVDLLAEQYGTLLSPEKIEAVAVSFQAQLQQRLERKISQRRSD